MGVKSSNFKIGDLVVQSNSDYNNKFFIICRINSIEYIDELSDMWLENYDEEPYYLYEAEIIYLKQIDSYHLELGDVVCYEEADLISLTEYLNTNITLDDYINRYYNDNF